MIEIGGFEKKYTSTGKHSGYIVEMYHEELDETRHLSASEISILEGKVNNQVNSWDKKWKRQASIQDKQSKEASAQEMTSDCRDALESIETLLAKTLDVDDTVDWDGIKNNDVFSTRKPKKTRGVKISAEPEQTQYTTKPPFLMVLMGKKSKHIESQEESFKIALKEWEQNKAKIEKKNRVADDKYIESIKQWESDRYKFNNKQTEFNQKIDEFKVSYQEKNPEAIAEYCEIVLNNSIYLDSFPKNFEIQYNKSNGILIVELQLPNIQNIPNKTMVKYVKARDEFEEKFLSQSAHSQLFDSAIYQIALRTIHELFEADTINAILSVSFNGLVVGIDPATGQKETKCIVSVQANKDEFLKINLANINPKLCFKSLKGVGSSKLSTITPIQPILQLDKSDKRFKDHYQVANNLDDSTNLASMHWEDFEHLVRELFEKEFAFNGGEVKVTQASSDGGVDAIAFDPDPIRGGKIVIQAKRYTNTVGVAAVRGVR